jgi:hypothetical protein
MAIPNASIYTTSLENIAVSVTPPTGVNPTSYTIEMAFLATPPPAQPSSADWVTATWLSTSVPYTALCLIGDGGVIQLTQGQWSVWLRLFASPEIPVKYAGILQVS